MKHLGKDISISDFGFRIAKYRLHSNFKLEDLRFHTKVCSFPNLQTLISFGFFDAI
jgi:hypothetical protein